MKKLYKWQIEILDALKEMSNEELLISTIYSAGGDDYDGCFTRKGEWEFAELQKELRNRLEIVGFLEKQKSRNTLKANNYSDWDSTPNQFRVVGESGHPATFGMWRTREFESHLLYCVR